MQTPSFLDEPSILYRQLRPQDFDFVRSDVSVAARTNAFYRVFLLFFLGTVLLYPTKTVVLSMLLTTLFVTLYVHHLLTKKKPSQTLLPIPSKEGFMSSDSPPSASEGGTQQYRKLTVNNPTGNYLPTDYLESPEAIPAPPANNEQANQERLELMEQAIINMNPHNKVLMEKVNASPVERKMFEKSLRPFLTNPVTAATTDMEAFVNFLGGPGFKTRKIGKEEFAKQAPLIFSIAN